MLKTHKIRLPSLNYLFDTVGIYLKVEKQDEVLADTLTINQESFLIGRTPDSLDVVVKQRMGMKLKTVMQK